MTQNMEDKIAQTIKSNVQIIQQSINLIIRSQQQKDYLNNQIFYELLKLSS